MSRKRRVENLIGINQSITISHEKDRRRIIRSFIVIEVMISAASLFLMLETAGTSDQSFLFGYSLTQIAILCLLLCALVAPVGLAILVFRKSSSEKLIQSIERILDRPKHKPLWLAFLTTAFVCSALFVFLLFLTRAGFYAYLFVRILPIALWFALTTLLLLVLLVIWEGRRPQISIKTIVLVLLVVGAGIALYAYLWNSQSAMFKDIFFLHREGKRLLELKNPYIRVLRGDMLNNEKYATLFPFFYELSAGVQLLGLHDFLDWLTFWKMIFLFAYVGIALLLFWLAYKKGFTSLALFGAFFWLFNRWTILMIVDADIDFVPIFFLIGSLILLPRNDRMAFLFFGLSLAIKQISIFILPIFLIWAWQSAESDHIKYLLKAAVWIAIIPFITSLPFLIWNFEAFTKSILFSATRLAYAANKTPSLDALLDWGGLLGKMPMLLLMLLIYLHFWSCRVKPLTAALLVMAVFVGFNSVFFSTYMVWLIPFIPLAAYEVAQGPPPAIINGGSLKPSGS